MSDGWKYEINFLKEITRYLFRELELCSGLNDIVFRDSILQCISFEYLLRTKF